MKFVCDACGARYVIDDARLKPGRSLRIRCKRCSHVITLTAPTQVVGGLLPERRATGRLPAFTAGTVPAPPASEPRNWHFARNGESFGPYTETELLGHFNRGDIGDEAYVWQAGFGEWKPAAEVPVFREAIRQVIARKARQGPATQRLSVVDLATVVEDEPAEDERTSLHDLDFVRKAGRSKKRKGGKASPPPTKRASDEEAARARHAEEEAARKKQIAEEAARREQEQQAEAARRAREEAEAARRRQQEEEEARKLREAAEAEAAERDARAREAAKERENEKKKRRRTGMLQVPRPSTRMALPAVGAPKSTVKGAAEPAAEAPPESADQLDEPPRTTTEQLGTAEPRRPAAETEAADRPPSALAEESDPAPEGPTDVAAADAVGPQREAEDADTGSPQSETLEDADAPAADLAAAPMADDEALADDDEATPPKGTDLDAVADGAPSDAAPVDLDDPDAGTPPVGVAAVETAPPPAPYRPDTRRTRAIDLLADFEELDAADPESGIEMWPEDDAAPPPPPPAKRRMGLLWGVAALLVGGIVAVILFGRSDPPGPAVDEGLSAASALVVESPADRHRRIQNLTAARQRAERTVLTAWTRADARAAAEHARRETARAAARRPAAVEPEPAPSTERRPTPADAVEGTMPVAPAERDRSLARMGLRTAERLEADTGLGSIGAPAMRATGSGPERLHQAGTEGRGPGADHFRSGFERMVRPAIQRCNQRHMGEMGEGLSGRVLLRFTIEPDGRVSALQAVDPQHRTTPFFRCLSGESSRWRFDPFEGRAAVVERSYVLQ